LDFNEKAYKRFRVILVAIFCVFGISICSGADYYYYDCRISYFMNKL